ncbi:FAD synthase-like isoform X2 [Belonocnema kinseyi]|nr:FAD synthase-like isoform X2 [Belonocnema kinseyi]
MEKNAAALIVVGDEILRGQTVDLNSSYLASKLYGAGFLLRKIVTIPDSVFEIAKEISDVSKNYPIVFTCGGVGPTHDDLTYEGVVKCFKLKLEENQVLLDLYTKLIPKQPEVRRLCLVPTPCEVIHIKSTEEFAVIKVQNVYILPGSPKYFKPAVDKIISDLEGGVPLYMDHLDTSLSELKIVKALDSFAEHWKGRVNIGSYPQQIGAKSSTRITFEGCKEDVLKLKEEFRKSFPENRFHDSKFDLWSAKRVLSKGQEQPHVKRALDILEECYDRFNPVEVFLSFNGGKDCTAVLHLAAAFRVIKGTAEPLLSLYITGDGFPEVEDFVKKASAYYGLRVVRKKPPLRESLAEFVQENPKLRACLMGTRKADPHGDGLEPFCKTDSGWPQLIRVNPIFDWTYNQVWKFLLDFEVPYCSLYDEGYSSIGAATSTFKNPLLKDPNNPSVYLPAHTLTDASAERNGRA